jgi:hypothetical protein
MCSKCGAPIAVIHGVPALCQNCKIERDLNQAAYSVLSADVSWRVEDLESLRAALALAKENYDTFCAIVEDLRADHRDGAHGLQRATREYAEATIRYSQALINRTRAILNEKLD